MGACDFTATAWGKTAAEAFIRARDHAQWEHGHGGYSGTIAEKGSFALFTAPPRVPVTKLIDWVASVEYNDDGDSREIEE